MKVAGCAEASFRRRAHVLLPAPPHRPRQQRPPRSRCPAAIVGTRGTLLNNPRNVPMEEECPPWTQEVRRVCLPPGCRFRVCGLEDGEGRGCINQIALASLDATSQSRDQKGKNACRVAQDAQGQRALRIRRGLRKWKRKTYPSLPNPRGSLPRGHRRDVQVELGHESGPSGRRAARERRGAYTSSVHGAADGCQAAALPAIRASWLIGQGPPAAS